MYVIIIYMQYILSQVVKLRCLCNYFFVNNYFFSNLLTPLKTMTLFQQ